MSTTTDFIAELVRAANELEKLTELERQRLLKRSEVTMRDMREGITLPAGQAPADKIIELFYMVREFGIHAETTEEVREVLLTAAGMIRDLHIVLDTGTAMNIAE